VGPGDIASQALRVRLRQAWFTLAVNVDDPEGAMPDEKDPEKEPCQPATGVSVPVSGMRTTNFSERARESEPPKPGSRKLPPRPGPVPEGREIDPGRIRNRNDKDGE
jgi:hypothetical protein